MCWGGCCVLLCVLAAACIATLTHMARYQAVRQREGRPVPVREWSRDFMWRIKTRFGEFLRLDLAESTRKIYGAQQEQYKAFCGHLGVAQQPAAEVLARFVVGRAVHGCKLSTIEMWCGNIYMWLPVMWPRGDVVSGVGRVLPDVTKH